MTAIRRQFRALRVAQTVRKSLANPVVERRVSEVAPPWLRVVEAIPPSAAVLARPVPEAHQPPNPRLRKPRRTYLPQRIVYEEDALRQTFFRDHPWELARPRVVVETDGRDYQRYDWSKGLLQPGLPLCGECVVQRQMWLMQHGMTQEQAYDAARREFYALRHKEEVQRRVAEEEARMVGAYFGKSALQVGMDLEDRTYEWWKQWAARETAKAEAERSKAYVSFGTEAAAEEAAVDGDEAAAAPKAE